MYSSPYLVYCSPPPSISKFENLFENKVARCLYRLTNNIKDIQSVRKDRTCLVQNFEFIFMTLCQNTLFKTYRVTQAFLLVANKSLVVRSLACVEGIYTVLSRSDAYRK